MEGDQLLFAKPFNVEGAAADEVLETLDDLGVADQAAGAAAFDLVPSRTASEPQTGQVVGKT